MRSVASTSDDILLNHKLGLSSNFMMMMDQAPNTTFKTSYSPRRVQASESIESHICSKPFYFDMFRLMSILYSQNISHSGDSGSNRKSKPLKVFVI